MKFEHLLQLYWTKGFLFGGKLLQFNQTKYDIISNIAGMNVFTMFFLTKRFEVNILLTDDTLLFSQFSPDELKIINMFFARIMNVNNNFLDWQKLKLIHLYLIKSYQGRCHAIGKPVHGQRTWSNAWTAYKYNKVIRLFIAKTYKSRTDDIKKLNFQIVVKKI